MIGNGTYAICIVCGLPGFVLKRVDLGEVLACASCHADAWCACKWLDWWCQGKADGLWTHEALDAICKEPA